MIALRPLRAAAILMAATASVSFASVAGAATQQDEPHHHHHHHKAGDKAAASSSGKTGSGKAGSGKTGAHHGRASAEGAATKTHGAKGHVTKKSGDHAEKPHHKASGSKHPHAGTAHPASGHPVAAPLPQDDGAPDTPGAVPDGANGPAGTPPEAPKGTNTGLPLPRFASLRADKVNMRAGPGERYPIQWVYHRRGLPVQIEREFDVWRLVEDSDGVKGWVHQATLAGARDFVVPSPAGTAPQGSVPPGSASSGGAPAGEAPAGGTSSAAGQSPDGGPKPGAADHNADQQAARHTESQVVGHIASVADVTGIPGAVVLRASADDKAAPVAVLQPGAVGTIKTCASGSAWCRVSVRQYDGWLKRSAIWGLSAGEPYPPS